MSLYFQENLKDLQRLELQQRLKDDTIIQNAAEAGDRIYNKRLNKELALQHQEYKQERQYELKLQERKERLLKIFEEEEQLKQALDLERKDLAHSKIVQYIRNSSQEIRDLEHKLNAARMNKELSVQIKERKLREKQIKEKEREPVTQKSKLLLELEKKEDEQERVKFEKTIDYKKGLEAQLAEKEVFANLEVEQFLKEKKKIDEWVQKFLREDEQAREEKFLKQKETKEYIDKFMKQKKEFQERERLRMEEEDRRIQEFLSAKKAREDGVEADKKAADGARQSLYEKLAHQMAESENNKLEMENIQAFLHQEQIEEKERQRERELLENRIKNRLAMLDSFNQQMQEKQHNAELEKAEEEQYREKLMEKYAADEKLEQMNAQKRRMRQLEHRKAVDKLIEDKRKQREREANEEIVWDKHQAELEAFRLHVVEQERQRLLREQAAKLVGYLPKGVIRDENDLNCFDSEFKDLVMAHRAKPSTLK